MTILKIGQSAAKVKIIFLDIRNYKIGGELTKLPKYYEYPDQSLLLPGEVFKDLNEWYFPDIVPGIYMVSNYGRIFRHDRGRILTNYEGYEKDNNNKYVSFWFKFKNGEIKPIRLHRVTLMMFGSSPFYFSDMVVNHKDGIKYHNICNVQLPDGTVENNLEWTTHAENSQHAAKMGLIKSGEENATSKINSDTVKQICELLQSGVYTNDQIAEMIGPPLTRSMVEHIKHRETWTEISKDYTFTPNRKKFAFTDEQVEAFCKFFQEDGNKSNLDGLNYARHTLDVFGYDYLADPKRYEELANYLSEIYYHRRYTRISQKYDF